MSVVNSCRFYLGAFIVVASTLRLLFAGAVELAPDEAYYWVWAQRPDWGYFDHPPMVAWIIRATTGVLGDTELGVRLGAVLIVAILTWVVYRLGVVVTGSSGAGLWCTLLANAALVFSAGAVIITPDTPLALFWATALYALVRAIGEERGRWWYVAGVATGLGLLSKYTMFFFPLAVLGYLILNPTGRKWLKRKEPYLAAVVALIVFTPNLWWNAAHHWDTFRFQLGRGFQPQSFIPFRYLGEFLGGQVGLITPFIFVGCLWVLLRDKVSARKHGGADGILWWSAALPLAFFLVIACFKRVEANWPAVCYLGALVGAVKLYGDSRVAVGEKEVAAGPLAWTTLGTAAAITLAVHLHCLAPFIPLSAKNDPTTQLWGWRELATEVTDMIGKYVFRRAPIMTDSYRLASEMNFYTGNVVGDVTRSGSLPWTAAGYCGFSPQRSSQYDAWVPPRPGWSGPCLFHASNGDEIVDYQDRRAMDLVTIGLPDRRREDKAVAGYGIIVVGPL